MIVTLPYAICLSDVNSSDCICVMTTLSPFMWLKWQKEFILINSVKMQLFIKCAKNNIHFLYKEYFMHCNCQQKHITRVNIDIYYRTGFIHFCFDFPLLTPDKFKTKGEYALSYKVYSQHWNRTKHIFFTEGWNKDWRILCILQYCF